MPDRPVSRRQFLGSAAAAAAVGPSVAVGPAPVPLVRPLLPTVNFAPETLPAGVARQFGAGRFRDVTTASGRFSLDARWILRLSDTECDGYELSTARRVRFRLFQDTDWKVTHWLPTTDGRLVVIEENVNDDTRTRLRWYDLPVGHPHPPVTLPGRVVGASPDGAIALLDRLTREPSGSCGVHIASGRVVWEHTDEFLPFPIDPCGRFATVGALMKTGEYENQPTLLDARTGRKVKLTPVGDKLYPTVRERAACVSADGSRLMIAVKKADNNWHDRMAVWDTGSGKAVGVIPVRQSADKPFDASYPIGLTADGKGWYGVDGDDRQLVVRGLASGEVIRRYPVFDVDESVSAVSPDGKTLLVGRTERGTLPVNTPDNKLIRLIDADTGATLPQSPDPPGPIVRVWFPTATTVAAAYRPRAAHLDYRTWDLTTGRGWNRPDPSDRNEQVRPTDADPIPLVSPDLAHTLRFQAARLEVLSTASGRPVAACDPPSSHNSRWFWFTAATVGIFSPAGLHLWEWATDRTRVIPLALPGRWPHVWRWHVSTDASTVTMQFLPHLSERVSRVAWLDVATGGLTVSDTGSPRSGVGFAVSADGGRAVVLLGKQTIHSYRRGGWDTFSIDPVHKGFDLTGCGRTLAVQCSGEVNDAGERVYRSLQLWEVASGERRRRHELSELVDDLRASACGRFVATVKADQPVYLWDVYGETSDPQPGPTAESLPQLWADLAGNAEVAFRAIRQLVQHPRAAVRLLETKLTPAIDVKAAWLDERIGRLGNPDFRIRQTAERELTAVADVAEKHLRAAADAGLESEEAEERLSRVLDRATAPTDWLRTVRAVEVLEHAGEATGPLLSRLANGAPGVLTRETTAAIRRRAFL